jgi:RimJ/RimL family protein N-acetyltransferase
MGALALKHWLIREALLEDARSLINCIEQINAETDFLAEPGQPIVQASQAQQWLRDIRTAAAGVYFIAISNDAIVGYLGAFCYRLARIRHGMFVPHIGIRKAFRGHGIGNGLFEALESWARSRRMRRLELRVNERNEHGIALYRKRGFRIDGRIDGAVLLADRWDAHYWMSLALEDVKAPPTSSLELPRPPRRDGQAHMTIDRPGPLDAGPMWEWERKLLDGSPFHLKLPDEVLSPARIANELAANRANDGRLQLAAFHGSNRQPIVGHAYAWVEPGLRLRHDAHIVLDVLESYSSGGIGRRLAAAIEVWARGRAIRRLTTWVQAHNARGLRFAEALGFKREILIPQYAVMDGRSVDRVGLGKLLVYG